MYVQKADSRAISIRWNLFRNGAKLYEYKRGLKLTTGTSNHGKAWRTDAHIAYTYSVGAGTVGSFITGMANLATN